MRIFIGNLPYDVTESDLQGCFSQWGELGRVVLMRDPVGGSRGFGFVDMTHDRDALLAIQELDGRDWDSRKIHVAEARPSNPRKQPA